jgi:sigma-B regulation protein RsbU (phosphoserine phosphatase)
MQSLTSDWTERLAMVEDMVRSISQQTDPQALVQTYGEKLQQLSPVERRISLSRRGLEAPFIRITRSTTWEEEIDPWAQPHLLPLIQGGLLEQLGYSNKTTIIDDLQLSPDDPAFKYFDGFRSLLAIPMYDDGESLNTVVLLQKKPFAFERNNVPDLVWRTNLFGRATSTLVLKRQLEEAYRELDRELKTVARLQRALLPAKIPVVPRMDLTAYYQPASRAGGDYYDFFELPAGRWGLFIADVSGHGTAAAVMMAVTHCIANTYPGPAESPAKLLKYLNRHLSVQYSSRIETFVTAFYAVYDPKSRRLIYSSAGHNPPRLKRCNSEGVIPLDKVNGLPLGVLEEAEFAEASFFLQFADQLVLYTDGITETHNPAGELFGEYRIDSVLKECGMDSAELMQTLVSRVKEFAEGVPPHDDQTIVILRAT